MSPETKNKLITIGGAIFGFILFVWGLFAVTDPGYTGDPLFSWGALSGGTLALIVSYFLFTKKRPGSLAVLIMGIMFTLLSYTMTQTTHADSRHSVTDTHIVGWIGLIFFGSATLVIIYRLLMRAANRTRELEYDDEYFYLEGRLPIAWKDIKRFEPGVYQGMSIDSINVIVSHPEQYVRKERNPLRRLLWQFNLSHGQTLCYSTRKYDGSLEEQLWELQQLLKQHRRSTHIVKEEQQAVGDVDGAHA